MALTSLLVLAATAVLIKPETPVTQVRRVGGGRPGLLEGLRRSSSEVAFLVV